MPQLVIFGTSGETDGQVKSTGALLDPIGINDAPLATLGQALGSDVLSLGEQPSAYIVPSANVHNSQLGDAMGLADQAFALFETP